MSVSDADLLKLETQAKFNAVSFAQHTSQSAWKQLAEALRELQERREKDTTETTNEPV
jgi:hypothetical protein